MINILAVDDEIEILTAIQLLLNDDPEYQVHISDSSIEALALIVQQEFDLILLDIMMPDIDGIELCRRIRANPLLNRTPVLFLTAKGTAVDIAHGLNVGGDDYLVKPFEPIELTARVHALLRRAQKLNDEGDALELVSGRLRLHMKRMDAEVNERVIGLTPIEHRLLSCLMQSPERPVSIDELLERVWGYTPTLGDPQLVRVHIANLRRKLPFDPEEPEYIRNVHGRGYIITGSGMA